VSPTLTIPPELAPYLERLTRIGVYGDTPGAVAEHLLRNAVARELRRDGLLREFTAAWNAAQEEPDDDDGGDGENGLGAQVEREFAEAGRR
jgi:hypothetical protein